MNVTRAKRNLPAWARFIVYPLVGMLAALALNTPAILFPEVTIEPLPPPPSPAQSISSIENYNFHYSVPGIMGRDGRSYSYQRFEPDLEWLEENNPIDTGESVACDRSRQQRFEKEVGTLEDCKQIQEWGEFCPGPFALYGIDEAGDVWLLLADTACFNIIMLQVLLFAGLGVIAAVIYSFWVVLRRRWDQKRHGN